MPHRPSGHYHIRVALICASWRLQVRACPLLTKSADPQMQFPAYYALVQIAVVQPFGVQQPVLAIPHTYVPMAYQTTAAPVQPPVATVPAVQHTPAMRTPVPAPGSTTPPAPVRPPPSVNHSHHRVMYKNKMYPTALHLLEAIKFTHQLTLQEMIQTCRDVNDMYPLSAGLQEHVRSEYWGQVFLKTVRGAFFLCCISSLSNIRFCGRCACVHALWTTLG